VNLAAYAQTLPNLFPIPNAKGILETYNIHDAPISLTGAFFQALGTNGRSCSTCHQAAQGWTVSAAGVQQRFLLTGGLDPIFRTNDGSVCDHGIDTSTLEGRRRAYSLLTSRGLIRISMPVPTGDTAEFTVQSVNNPYGCNETANLSMYRRPLPATNLNGLSAVMWDGRESSLQTGTTPINYGNYPGSVLSNLAHQAMDATTGHAQGAMPTAGQIQDIVNFETSLRTAQAYSHGVGRLDANSAAGGSQHLAAQPFYIGINDSFPLSFNFNFGIAFDPKIFNLFDVWKDSQQPHRASIARGEALFNSKPITISGVGGINDLPEFPSSFSGTCGTCHDSPNLGNHSVAVPLNIGVGDLHGPLNLGYLPVFTLVNKTTNKVFQTTDPGRALITGKWADVGKVKGPILRGLVSRAPYFHNGSAATLEDVLDFYTGRFGVFFTDQEKTDLIAFLNAL
jgi:cytochrome c peroxidase